MASNNNTGFTMPKGPKEKLTVEQAKKRFEENLAAMEQIQKDLKKTIDELEKMVA